jgi:hypothetical protein
VVSADPSNVVAFRPVVLWPGASVSVVIAETAGICARPAAALPASSYDEPLAGMQAVYGLMGWRRETTVYAPFQIAVAGEDTCPLR